ncbi:ATP-binding protein [Clostridium magnum]|uniref:Serine-protein kinase RsbW n=2 Tax=Clostridium magnum TaxID=33954 RepID=A0A161WT05_9CLOT|nr:ATP-binding protein [Clostridium magnum]KZL89978.1 serine-protein kinase RsbW [Clostridium magnum DSM 2767]SHJ63343.1 serine/threonine-protein kinase RsbW [Clostridium magnum DSM 2767]
MLNLIKNTLTLYGINGYNNIIESVIKALNAYDYYFDIKLILTEALLNAFEHGNNSDKNKPISLFYNFDGKYLNFKITSSEKTLPKINIPESVSNEDLLKEHGRGLFLIKSLSDKVEFKGNSLLIQKSILDNTNTEVSI